MGILVVSPFWLLWAWMCKCLLQVLSSTPLGVGPDVKFLDPTMPSTVQFRNIFDHSEVVISIQSKGSFRWDSAEMQADTSKFVLTIWLMLGDVKWFVFNLKWFVFNWFSSPVSFFFFFSYSIKLLAVQELLDREALEKVNLLFLPPHHHKHRAEGHTREKLNSLWPEIALTAKCVCYFVLTSQWSVQHFHPRFPHCSHPVTNSALLSHFRVLLNTEAAFLFPFNTRHWTRLHAGPFTPLLCVGVSSCLGLWMIKQRPR